jgi:hypothetical protein
MSRRIGPPTGRRGLGGQVVFDVIVDAFRSSLGLGTLTSTTPSLRVAATGSGELQRKLVAFDMDAATVPVDGLTLVEVVRDGRRTTPTAILGELGADRKQVLSARRREVLGKALLGEIAEHLRTKVGSVRASIRDRNDTLRRCPTGGRARRARRRAGGGADEAGG